MKGHSKTEITFMQTMIGKYIDQFAADTIIAAFPRAKNERLHSFLECVVEYAAENKIKSSEEYDELVANFELDAERLHRLIAEGDCAAASALLSEMAPTARLRSFDAEMWLAAARNAPQLPLTSERISS